MRSEIFTVCQVSGLRRQSRFSCHLRPATCHLAFLRFLFILRRNNKTENRILSGARDVHSTRVFGVGQVERLTKFAAIHFGVRSPGFLHVTAFLFEHVGGVEPAFQVSSAELALFVFLVAGTLSRFLDLDFVVGKLRNRARDGGRCFTGSHSISCAACKRPPRRYFTQPGPLDQTEPETGTWKCSREATRWRPLDEDAQYGIRHFSARGNNQKPKSVVSKLKCPVFLVR